MDKKVNRREFLKGLPFFSSLREKLAEERKEERKEEVEKINLIRPPYSQGADFSLCKECDGKCASVCEEGIIKIFKDGSPYIAFNGKGCNFCGDCAEACEYGVLDINKPARIEMTIEINTEKCIAWHNVMCFSCKEPCLENAIKFEGLFRPTIDSSLCNGCGYCVSVCPSGAIDYYPLEN